MSASRPRANRETIFINGNIYTVNTSSRTLRQSRQGIASFSLAQMRMPNNSGPTKHALSIWRVNRYARVHCSHCHIFGIGEREMT